MKKLLREEKIVSTTGNIATKIFILSFLFLSNLSAQIPVNGFCRYREFPIKANFTNVYGVDYTIDGFRDLIVYKPNENRYLTLTADDKSNFKNAEERFSSFPISEMHAMANENNSQSYFVLSRKTRQAGIASFSKSGSIVWKNKIKFDGFPSRIDVASVDNNSKRAGLVSGGALEGLHVISENKNNLQERVFAQGKTFVFSTFIDLDYDKYFDIAAFDEQSNSFVFFYNNHYGGFDESRKIGMIGDLSEFKSSDINSDGFTDLVFVRDNHIEALLGDSVSSFQNKLVLDTPVKPDRYVIQDFNGDGFNDVAYLNKESGELYISFAKSTNTFYPPILYMKKNGIIDLVSYVDRGGKKLVVLSSDGKLYLINTVMLNDNNFSIAIGLNPGLVATFDYLNDSFKDICYVNTSEPSLNLLISERRNLFRTYYSIPIAFAFDEIRIDDTHNRQKTFFLYSSGKREVEVVNVNFDNFNYSRKTFYVNGPIIDLNVVVNKTIDQPTVYALVKMNESLLRQRFEFRNFGYVQVSSEEIPVLTNNAKLLFNPDPEICYWTKSASEIELKKSSASRSMNGISQLIVRTLLPKEDAVYDMICFSEKIGRSKPVGAVISSQKKTDLYFVFQNQTLKFPLQFQSAENPQLKYYIDNAGNKIFFSYADKRGKLRGVSIDPILKKAKQSEVTDAQKINDYVIESLSAYRSFFIYSDNFHNTITFQKF